VIVLDFFLFALSIFFFIMNTSYLTLTTKHGNSSLKGNESAMKRCHETEKKEEPLMSLDLPWFQYRHRMDIDLL